MVNLYKQCVITVSIAYHNLQNCSFFFRLLSCFPSTHRASRVPPTQTSQPCPPYPSCPVLPHQFLRLSYATVPTTRNLKINNVILPLKTKKPIHDHQNQNQNHKNHQLTNTKKNTKTNPKTNKNLPCVPLPRVPRVFDDICKISNLLASDTLNQILKMD